MGGAPGQKSQIPIVLPKVQQFLQHKHFSDCCMPLVYFQSAEIVDFLGQFCLAL